MNNNQEPQEDFTLEMLRRIMDSLDELYAIHVLESERADDSETRNSHIWRATQLLGELNAVNDAVARRQQRGDA